MTQPSEERRDDAQAEAPPLRLLLLSAGGYKFSDFMRAGIPLAALMWLGFSIILPIIYDL